MKLANKIIGKKIQFQSVILFTKIKISYLNLKIPLQTVKMRISMKQCYSLVPILYLGVNEIKIKII